MSKTLKESSFLQKSQCVHLLNANIFEKISIVSDTLQLIEGTCSTGKTLVFISQLHKYLFNLLENSYPSRSGCHY